MLELSAQLSLLIQFLTGGIDVYGLSIEVPESKNIFRELLQIELAVQTVEFVYYIWLVGNLGNQNITMTRYIDWFITTPTMLLTLMAYLEHPGSKGLREFYEKHKRFVHKVLSLNAIMLVLGFLGEAGVISNEKAVLLGFVPFVYYFKIIHDEFMSSKEPSRDQRFMYWFYFLTWSLYGVAALMPFRQKNTFYNVLDLFAKNALGLFLVYILWKNRIQEDDVPPLQNVA
jgi:bacteriorhodopsin